MSGAHVKDVDHGFNALHKALGSLKKADIRIGIQGSEASDTHENSNATIAEIGYFHEYGLGVPRRSFLSDWMDEQEEEISETLKAVVTQITKGSYDAETGLERAGARFVGLVQQRIAENIPPPLAESTIAAKGSDVALIDTGVLRSSITYVVKLDRE